MAKAIITAFGYSNADGAYHVSFELQTGNTSNAPTPTDVDFTGTYTLNSSADIFNACVIEILAYSVANSFGLAATDIIWPVGSQSGSRTISTPTRSLGTAYQPSTTQDTLVIMSVEIDASLSLSGGTKGTCTLEVAPTSGFSTVVNDSENVNGNTGTLTLGLNTVGAGGGTMVAFVPAGYYYKAVTANTTGTPTFTVLGTTEIAGI